jgi:hypothetical protein
MKKSNYPNRKNPMKIPAMRSRTPKAKPQMDMTGAEPDLVTIDEYKKDPRPNVVTVGTRGGNITLPKPTTSQNKAGTNQTQPVININNNSTPSSNVPQMSSAGSFAGPSGLNIPRTDFNSMGQSIAPSLMTPTKDQSGEVKSLTDTESALDVANVATMGVGGIIPKKLLAKEIIKGIETKNMLSGFEKLGLDITEGKTAKGLAASTGKYVYEINAGGKVITNTFTEKLKSSYLSKLVKSTSNPMAVLGILGTYAFSVSMSLNERNDAIQGLTIAQRDAIKRGDVEGAKRINKLLMDISEPSLINNLKIVAPFINYPISAFQKLYSARVGAEEGLKEIVDIENSNKLDAGGGQFGVDDNIDMNPTGPERQKKDYQSTQYSGGSGKSISPTGAPRFNEERSKLGFGI